MKKFIVFLCFCIAPYSFAGTVQVPVDQPTIQAAINAASDGDTVLFHPERMLRTSTSTGRTLW